MIDEAHLMNKLREIDWRSIKDLEFKEVSLRIQNVLDCRRQSMALRIRLWTWLSALLSSLAFMLVLLSLGTCTAQLVVSLALMHTFAIIVTTLLHVLGKNGRSERAACKEFLAYVADLKKVASAEAQSTTSTRTSSSRLAAVTNLSF